MRACVCGGLALTVAADVAAPVGLPPALLEREGDAVGVREAVVQPERELEVEVVARATGLSAFFSSFFLFFFASLPFAGFSTVFLHDLE